MKTLILFLAIAGTALAQNCPSDLCPAVPLSRPAVPLSRCPNGVCPSIAKAVASVANLTATELADLKAKIAAERDIRNRHVTHHQGKRLGFGGGNIEGCGFTNNLNSWVPTCSPCNNRCKACRAGSSDCTITGAKLLADKTYGTKIGRYRYRIWKQ